ncbi:MAG: fimbrillin family protein, partial [Muribaculaceae bacterium]|nr:fimbrillin family protein [Muribaculaceae bacterium]
MKKILFMMGAAALALSSCSQEEVISANNGKNDANLITFRVRSQKPSRAMEFSTYNLDDFMVYGFKGDPDDGEE